MPLSFVIAVKRRGTRTYVNEVRTESTSGRAGHPPEYDPRPIHHLTRADTMNIKGMTRCLRPCLCIQRVHLLAIPLSSAALSSVTATGLDKDGESVACLRSESMTAVKLDVCRFLVYVGDSDTCESGEMVRDTADTGDSGGEPSQCWLSERCKVKCLRGTGATMSEWSVSDLARCIVGVAIIEHCQSATHALLRIPADVGRCIELGVRALAARLARLWLESRDAKEVVRVCRRFGDESCEERRVGKSSIVHEQREARNG